MKPLRTLLAAALLPFSTLHANLLPNPGFEDQLNEWKVLEEPKPVSIASADAAHEGKLGLHIAGPGGKLESALFDVNPGQKVTLSFWGRSTKSALGAVMIVPYGGNKRPLLNEQGRPPVIIGLKQSADWMPYEQEYTLPENAVYLGVWIRSWTKAEGALDLDDFVLKVE